MRKLRTQKVYFFLALYSQEVAEHCRYRLCTSFWCSLVMIPQEEITLNRFSSLSPSIFTLVGILTTYSTISGTKSLYGKGTISQLTVPGDLVWGFVMLIDTGSLMVNDWWPKVSCREEYMSENLSILDFSRHTARQMSPWHRAASIPFDVNWKAYRIFQTFPISSPAEIISQHFWGKLGVYFVYFSNLKSQI